MKRDEQAKLGLFSRWFEIKPLVAVCILLLVVGFVMLFLVGCDNKYSYIKNTDFYKDGHEWVINSKNIDNDDRNRVIAAGIISDRYDDRKYFEFECTWALQALEIPAWNHHLVRIGYKDDSELELSLPKKGEQCLLLIREDKEYLCGNEPLIG